MTPKSSKRELKALLPSPLKLATLRDAVTTVIEFYRDERADGVDIDSDGDMLLYETHLDNVDEPATYAVSLTRQFMLDDEDEPYQLKLAFNFRQTAESKLLTGGDAWCDTPDQADVFQKMIEQSPAFKIFADSKAKRVELTYEQV